MEFKPEVIALVDVELFVRDGAPRSAFELVSEAYPFWYRVSAEELLKNGFAITEQGAWRSPPGPLSSLVHPFELGPGWEGIANWTAEFGTEDGGSVHCVVSHELLLSQELRDGVRPSATSSPWIWLVESRVRGRSNSPVEAAADAESAAAAMGASIPSPTITTVDRSLAGDASISRMRMVPGTVTRRRTPQRPTDPR